MHPPWSTATSTSTDPGFIVFRWRFWMSCGARAPAMSTAPMTRSASGNSSSMLAAVEKRVETLAGITVSRYLSLLGTAMCKSSAGRVSSYALTDTAIFFALAHLSRFTSMMVTFAPRPAAILAASVPTTPQPKTRTFPLAVPGTPPSRTPRPPGRESDSEPHHGRTQHKRQYAPIGFSRYLAPSCVAMRPAISDMGTSRGSERSAFSTVSYAMHT